MSFWNRTPWHRHSCKNQSPSTLLCLVHIQSSNKKCTFCHSAFKLCNEKRCQLPSSYCTDHANRPWLCDVCREIVKMTHSFATYGAVNDYDNSHTALHKQLCGAALIIPDSLWLPILPTFPIILFLSNFPLCVSARLHVSLSFPVLANHTQEGCCCWILILIYTASLWCPPITPSVQCKHFSISRSASTASPEYLPLRPVLWVCVLTVDITQEVLTMLEYMGVL